VTREKLNLGLFGWDSSLELNTKKLDHSPRFPSITYIDSSDQRFRSYGILHIGKTAENWTGQHNNWKPNAIPLGNSLHFFMVPFTTPNGQWLTSYGYQNMAGLLTRGNLNRLDLSEQIRNFMKFRHDLPRNFVYEKCRQWTQVSTGYSYDSFWYMVRSLRHFWSPALVLDTLWTDWIAVVRSGFWATRWVRLARVRIQLLKEIESAFRRLLKHNFL
jgi:hypothetical protein